MRTEAGLKKYIYDLLVGLNIGPVFQDRKPFDDTTKQRAIRTYILVDFPNGIEDQGPWYYAQCSVNIGCRDKDRFVADLATLDKCCMKFREIFDYNDDPHGMSCIDVEFIEDFSDGVGNHEYQYIFDVYAQKWPEIEDEWCNK